MLGLRRFAPFSLPPRAIIDRSKSGLQLCWGLVFSHCTALMKASFRRSGTARKKRSTKVERFCFGRDSVGIRTQDPQLRRLLLYPTELPNRSLWNSVFRKVDAKVVKKIVIASAYFSFDWKNHLYAERRCMIVVCVSDELLLCQRSWRRSPERLASMNVI